MDDLGHEWTIYYLCSRCGIAQHEATTLGIRCTAAEEDQADTPVIVGEDSS